jgi:hypothetical protein
MLGLTELDGRLRLAELRTWDGTQIMPICAIADPYELDPVSAPNGGYLESSAGNSW